MKTRNLTQISLQNDPINRRMHGFSFRIDEDENWSSRCDFFILLRSNFDFIHSNETEMSCEHRETNDTRLMGKSFWWASHFHIDVAYLCGATHVPKSAIWARQVALQHVHAIDNLHI